MNYAYYEGKNTDVKEVIDLAETLPFFSERRLIVFENTGFFKNSGADMADISAEGCLKLTYSFSLKTKWTNAASCIRQ